MLPAVVPFLVTIGLVVYTLVRMNGPEDGGRRLLALVALMNAFGTIFDGTTVVHLVVAAPGNQRLMIGNGASSTR